MGAARRMLNGYPKGLLVKCCETDVAGLTKECLTRPVMETVPESRPTSKSPLAAHVSTASYGIEVASSNCLYITAIMILGII